jgi:hypothetical protein
MITEQFFFLIDNKIFTSAYYGYSTNKIFVLKQHIILTVMNLNNEYNSSISWIVSHVIN